jgi:hypothetical protein
VQAHIQQDPPADACLVLVHSAERTAGHTFANVYSDQAAHKLVIGRIPVPAGLLAADGLLSPYMQLFCLAAEGSGSAAIKSRRNLARSGQGGA